MSDLNSRPASNHESSGVCLIGAGTVGRAILDEYLKYGIGVLLADTNELAIQAISRHVIQKFPNAIVKPMTFRIDEMASVELSFGQTISPTLVIESVTENLTIKNSLVTKLRTAFGPDIVLTSNTSNLRIADVFTPLANDARCCGLHFFMPVAERPLLECIVTANTSASTRAVCELQAQRIGKKILYVKDSPGFLVNRLLAPYLNQSLRLLEYGLDPEQLGEAALDFGMPMSPLKLIDTIGLRTAFDSGRVFWQSFPMRIDPSPILPALVKAARAQTDANVCFYDLMAMSETATRIIANYQRPSRRWTTADIVKLISLPMWIEAVEVLASRIVDDPADIELAMSNGLGYRSERGFFAFFDSLGIDVVRRQIESAAVDFAGLKAPAELLNCLTLANSVAEAMTDYVKTKRGAAH